MYILFTGAPGSKWSSVAKNIYRSPDIDQSDSTSERSYNKGTVRHTGSYFDPGMEFGHELENFDSLSKQDLEKIFDAPFQGSDKIRIIKSHVLSKHVDRLAYLFDDPIVLVHRHDQHCFDWWKEAGGWDITYPNYQWFKDDDTMKQQIASQNQSIRNFVSKHRLYSLNDNIELQKTLGIKSMNYLRFTDVEVYCKIKNESENS